MSTSYLRPAEAQHGSGPGGGHESDLDEVRPSHRRRRLVIAAAIALVLVLVAVWVVVLSSLFGVRTVDVRGAHSLTAAQIRSAADVTHGTPLVRLDTAAVTGRVERLPDVASAQVSTSFPSTVTITVVERHAVGYVRSGGQDHLVDATGAQYHAVGTAPKSLPRFVLPVGAPARTTGRSVATVAAALPAPIRARVASVQAIDPASITLLLRGGIIVQWGTAARSADKARILPALLKLHPTQVDVTDADRPFIRH